MTNGRVRLFAGLIALAVIAGYFAVWLRGADDIEFAELESPAGFRALVLDGGSSRSDPIVGALQEAPAAGGATDLDLCGSLLRDDASPALGAPDAAISVVEFFDYRCPYCKTLTKILSQLHAGKSVRVVYKEWPILGASSRLAARAALAASRQGKYLAFHTRLMGAGFIPTDAYIENLSTSLNIDHVQLRVDMRAPETTAALERNAALASKLGLAGTPALVVGRTIVQGAITERQLERLIAIETSSQAPACRG